MYKSSQVSEIELREPNILSNLQWRVDKLVMKSKAKATNDTDIIYSDEVNVEDIMIKVII